MVDIKIKIPRKSDSRGNKKKACELVFLKIELNYHVSLTYVVIKKKNSIRYFNERSKTRNAENSLIKCSGGGNLHQFDLISIFT